MVHNSLRGTLSPHPCVLKRRSPWVWAEEVWGGIPGFVYLFFVLFMFLYVLGTPKLHVFAQLFSMFLAASDWWLSIFLADFSMSDSQKEHVASIVQFVPGLESLRQMVCHELSDLQFWMIYFVLLLPRLSGNDLELLSTPEASFSLTS